MKLCLIFCVFVIISVASSFDRYTDRWNWKCEEQIHKRLDHINFLEKRLTTCQMKPKECGPLPDIENAHFNDSPGSVANVVCNGDRYHFFGSSQQVTCMESGNWSSLDGKCKQVEWNNFIPYRKKPYNLPDQVKTGWSMDLIATPMQKNGAGLYFIKQNIYVALAIFLDFSKNITKALADDYKVKVFTTKLEPFAFGKKFVLKLTVGETDIQTTVDGISLPNITDEKVIGDAVGVLLSPSLKVATLRFNY